MTKVIVTFEKNWRGYAARETAGFDSAIAESLIESGYATEAGKPGEKKAKSGIGNAPSGKKPDSDAAAGDAGNSGKQTDADGKP